MVNYFTYSFYNAVYTSLGNLPAKPAFSRQLLTCFTQLTPATFRVLITKSFIVQTVDDQ